MRQPLTRIFLFCEDHSQSQDFTKGSQPSKTITLGGLWMPKDELVVKDGKCLLILPCKKTWATSKEPIRTLYVHSWDINAIKNCKHILKKFLLKIGPQTTWWFNSFQIATHESKMVTSTPKQLRKANSHLQPRYPTRARYVLLYPFYIWLCWETEKWLMVSGMEITHWFYMNRKWVLIHCS